MRPVTHPLAIAYVEAIRDKCDPLPALMQWRDARFPLYADPTPMPAPALGMRAYGTYPPEPNGTATLTESDDIYHLKPGAEWCDYFDPAARIDLIVDFRTREVLWRRS